MNQIPGQSPPTTLPPGQAKEQEAGLTSVEAAVPGLHGWLDVSLSSSLWYWGLGHQASNEISSPTRAWLRTTLSQGYLVSSWRI